MKKRTGARVKGASAQEAPGSTIRGGGHPGVSPQPAVFDRRTATCFLVCSALKLGPVISTKCAPCVRRSSAAEASKASPKKPDHSDRSRFEVRMIDARS